MGSAAAAAAAAAVRHRQQLLPIHAPQTRGPWLLLLLVGWRGVLLLPQAQACLAAAAAELMLGLGLGPVSCFRKKQHATCKITGAHDHLGSLCQPSCECCANGPS